MLTLYAKAANTFITSQTDVDLGWEDLGMVEKEDSLMT